jgi:hypothetical protein
MVQPQNRKYQIGEKFTNKKNLEYSIIEYLPQGKYLIEFTISKYQAVVSASVIKKQEIMDRLAPCCSGVGYIGTEYTSRHPLYPTWLSILSRCYDTTDKDYPRYGAKGIIVDPHWHNFTNFVNDITQKDNYESWLAERGKWHLDKDIYSKCTMYSNDNVYIISAQENGGKIKQDDRIYPYGIYKTTTPNGSQRIIAQHKRKSRSFNIDKYGEEEAVKLAIEALQQLKCLAE